MTRLAIHRFVLGTAAAAFVTLTGSVASAQTVTGTVNITGFVSARCGTLANGASPFGGTIALGELSQQTNGALLANLAGSTANSPAGEVAFEAGCTGTASTVTLRATRLSTPGTALPGGSSNIDYTAEVKIALAAGGFATIDYRTALSAPAATVQSISGPYANVANNLTVSLFALAAENGPTSLLTVGDYTATITVIIAPA